MRVCLISASGGNRNEDLVRVSALELASFLLLSLSSISKHSSSRCYVDDESVSNYRVVTSLSPSFAVSHTFAYNPSANRNDERISSSELFVWFYTFFSSYAPISFSHTHSYQFISQMIPPPLKKSNISLSLSPVCLLCVCITRPEFTALDSYILISPALILSSSLIFTTHIHTLRLCCKYDT